jgi:hypothetical protein
VFRHAVLLNFKPEADETYRAKVAASVNALPDAIPQVRAAACGQDAGLTKGSSDFAIIVDLDSVDDYPAYDAHEAHLALVELIRQGVASRAVADFTY